MKSMSVIEFRYPLNFLFKITTISNDFTAKDASGKTIFYVREKIFKLRDHIKVFRDESKKEVMYDFVSNKIIDFQQTFTMTNAQKQVVGKVRKKTLRSFIKATYHLQDADGNHIYTIKERNAAVRVLDAFFDELPLIGMLSGYVFNPKYVVTDLQGNELMEMSKKPSFWGRKFDIRKLSNQPFNEEQVVLSLALMVIQQRDRG